MKLKDLVGHLTVLLEKAPDIDVVVLGTYDGITVPPPFIFPAVGSGIHINKEGTQVAFVAARVPKEELKPIAYFPIKYLDN